MIIDQAWAGHVRVTGADRARFLHGLTTCNVTALAPGGHTWGAILSPQEVKLFVDAAAKAR